MGHRHQPHSAIERALPVATQAIEIGAHPRAGSGKAKHYPGALSLMVPKQTFPMSASGPPSDLWSAPSLPMAPAALRVPLGPHRKTRPTGHPDTDVDIAAISSPSAGHASAREPDAFGRAVA